MLKNIKALEFHLILALTSNIIEFVNSKICKLFDLFVVNKF
jgi:hypothetical protein